MCIPKTNARISIITVKNIKVIIIIYDLQNLKNYAVKDRTNDEHGMNPPTSNIRQNIPTSHISFAKKFATDTIATV